MNVVAKIVAIDEHSVAGEVKRVIEDAVADKRMSRTEASVIYDLLTHDDFPASFFIRFGMDGAGIRQRRF